ncbi:MAG: four helix bundle protein [Ekhidna sp.]
MTTEELKKRTLKFGVDMALFCQIIHPNPLLKPYANQLIRCSSSVGANYRAACRAKSGADFIYKLKIVEEECDESMFFLELIKELKPDSESSINPIWKEANEILSIVVASIGTARKSLSNRNNLKSK